MANKCPYEEIESQRQQYNLQNQQFNMDEDEISLKELLMTIVKGKKTILLVTVVVVIIALLGSMILPNLHLGTKGEVQTAVQLYFPDIEKGNGLDGNAYDVNEIKSAEILQRAIDNVSLSSDPSVTDLINCISFKALLPDEAAKTLQNISGLKTEELKLERLESLVINPDIYIVTLDVSNNLGITLEEGRELLDNVMIEYKALLVERYAGYEVLADVYANDFSLDKYDYIQAADLANNQLNSMEEYINTNMTNSEFNSVVTGLSKADLNNAVEAIRRVEVEQLYTKIAAFYITKDAGKSVAIYEKLADNKDREYSQSIEEATALFGLVQNFKGNEQTLIVGDSTNEPLALKTQNAQYDNMVSQYILAGSKAASAAADAAYYRAESERFKSADILSGEGSDEAKESEALILRIKKNLIYWTGMINKTTRDYYSEETYQKFSEQLIPAQNYNQQSNVNLPLNMGVGLAIGLFLGILIVFFRKYLKEEDNETVQINNQEIIEQEVRHEQ